MTDLAVEIWYVYLVECADGSFYTGISNNVEKRIVKHNSSQGAKYTKTRLPVKLIYKEKCGSKSDASKREYELKQLTRSQKEKLISHKVFE